MFALIFFFRDKSFYNLKHILHQVAQAKLVEHVSQTLNPAFLFNTSFLKTLDKYLVTSVYGNLCKYLNNFVSKFTFSGVLPSSDKTLILLVQL